MTKLSKKVEDIVRYQDLGYRSNEWRTVSNKSFIW